MTSILSSLIAAHALPDVKELEELGRVMFVFFSEKGLPPDMFMDHLQVSLTNQQKLVMVESYLFESLQHKRNSAISEERVEQIRKQNIDIISKFIKTGELAIY